MLSDNKTLFPLKNWLEEVIDVLKNKGNTFNHIAEIHIITIAKKRICHTISILNITCMLSKGN